MKHTPIPRDGTMFAVMLFAASAMLCVVAGCDDGIDSPPPDSQQKFWSNRGLVVYSRGLLPPDSGEIRAISTDGTGDRLLDRGIAPCTPRGDSIVTANYFTGHLSLVRRGSPTPVELVPGGGQLVTAVSFSPTSDRIAYVHTVNSSGVSRSDLYVVRTDGTGNTLIARDVVNSASPVFSPNGRRLAYYSGSQQSIIMVSDVTGSPMTKVAQNARPWTIESLDWSPHGDSIIYVGGEEGARRIFIVHFEGGRMRALTDSAGRDDRWPVFAPSGDSIAFIRDGELWTMHADGTHQRQITSGGSAEFRTKMFPEWSPDGSMILFTAVAANGLQGLLQVVDLATLRINALAPDVVRGFWLPPNYAARRSLSAPAPAVHRSIRNRAEELSHG